MTKVNKMEIIQQNQTHELKGVQNQQKSNSVSAWNDVKTGTIEDTALDGFVRNTKPEEVKQPSEPDNSKKPNLEQEQEKHQNVVNFISNKFLVSDERRYRVATQTVTEKVAARTIQQENGMTIYLDETGKVLDKLKDGAIKEYDAEGKLISEKQGKKITYYGSNGNKLSEKIDNETTYYDSNGNKSYKVGPQYAEVTFYDEDGNEIYHNENGYDNPIILPGYENYRIFLDFAKDGQFSFMDTVDGNYNYSYATDVVDNEFVPVINISGGFDPKEDINNSNFDYNGNILSVTKFYINSEGKFEETITRSDGRVTVKVHHSDVLSGVVDKETTTYPDGSVESTTISPDSIYMQIDADGKIHFEE